MSLESIVAGVVEKVARPKSGYWYLITYDECPVCGRFTEYRERQYTSRPSDPEQRHVCREYYDWCEEERI